MEDSSRWVKLDGSKTKNCVWSAKFQNEGKEMDCVVKRRSGSEFEMVKFLEKYSSSRIVRSLFPIGSAYWAMTKIQSIEPTWCWLLNASPQQLCTATVEMLEAIEICHAAGIIHCDIKPENFVVSSCGMCLIDFGSACFSDKPWNVSQVDYTDTFAAPEVLVGHLRRSARSEDIAPSIDTWAIGCILLFCTHESLLERAKEFGMCSILREKFGSCFDPLGLDSPYDSTQGGQSWLDVCGGKSTFLERKCNQELIDGLCCLAPKDRWDASRAKNWINRHGFT